ncbi:hypothetical protein GCM10008171_14270 [Methylopila jiangsuensis]|uniref:Type I restriction modification DNA specificity domain-containing protein n=1 Tax=Methylopila jiangsuensis TaxID=586230 RepID=A0A9W6JH67_9HYPH|nr:restriction endonuclease subunit S [Methylopila jiangsuensis]MDR6284309.1 type I restriction enzyme S subunit [Methylopila jiangsuensis]GLK76173.1 hypothetical protein GCM10008171_14270 [Methylopila jiangsuensis]
MSFPPYCHYKHSGIEWLGELPVSWQAYPGRRIFRQTRMPRADEDEQLSASQKYGVLPQTLLMRLDDQKVVLALEGIDNFKHVDEDDFVISLRSFQGGIERSKYSGCVSPAYTVLKSRIPIHSSFFAYALKCKPYIGALQSVTDGIRDGKNISYDQFGIVGLPLPPLEEQAVIAAFLDRETAKIDALVEEQRRLIALLKEKRQAVISDAVTKGLNPNAPMKDSGVEWLGEVPAHWEVGPLKRYVKNFDGRRIPLSSEERGHRTGSVPYYGASGIIDYIDEHIFDEDLVLVSEDGANLVTRSTPIAFVATGRYWVNNHAHILKPQDGRNLFWAERIEAINLTSVITGSAQPKLTADALANLRVAVPPSVDEREQIEAAIDGCRNASDPLLAEAQRAILLLTERRSTLISLAVTGKIDVRGTANVLPLPVDRARARGLIATEIIERSAHQATFGRVKLQKIVYLAEAHAGVSEVEGAYLREAAGPLDREMIRDMEREAGALAGVRVEQPDGVGSAVTYRLGDRRGTRRQELAALLGDRAAKFDKLIEDIGTIGTKGAEAVATLYAVWNDALIDGDTPADMEIKLAVLSEWHPEKAEKFTINDLQIWLDWMRRHGLVPTGAGPKTTTGRLFA